MRGPLPVPAGPKFGTAPACEAATSPTGTSMDQFEMALTQDQLNVGVDPF